MTALGERLSTAIRDAAATAPGGPAFRRRVLELVRQYIPFDAACLGTTEPTSMLPTSMTTVGYEGAQVYATVLDIEYGRHPEPGNFDSMHGRAVPVLTHHEATGGRPRSSRYYAEVLAPHGLDHEVRMLFPDEHGLTWGACTLARRGVDFSDAETAALEGVVTEVAHGLASTLFGDHLSRCPDRADGPALVVLDGHNEVASCTAAAFDYLRCLGWGPSERPLEHLPAFVLATWLRRSGRRSAACRLPMGDGSWVVVRGGLVPDAGVGTVALTFEPAQASVLASLAATAYGLTAREREVFAHLLAYRTREEIARALFLSPHTVQDHVKSIYAKTGTTGRRGLIALLVHEQCLPRLGSELGADGWFADPT